MQEELEMSPEEQKVSLEEQIKVLGNAVYFLHKGRFDLNMEEAGELRKCINLFSNAIDSLKTKLESLKPVASFAAAE